MNDQAVAANFFNPYKKIKINRSWLIKLELFALLALSWFALLSFLPFFKIRYIVIKGTNLVDSNLVENSIRTIISAETLIPGDNIIFINSEKISDEIKQQFNFQEINIEKSFPNKIVVKATEKKPIIIVNKQSESEIIDENGSQLLKIPSGSLYINVQNTSTNSTTTIKKLSEEKINFLRSAHQLLPLLILNEADLSFGLKKENIRVLAEAWELLEQGSRIKILYAAFKPIESSFELYTEHGYKIQISTERSVQPQISALIKVLTTNEPKEYIDVRIEDRVFWK